MNVAEKIKRVFLSGLQDDNNVADLIYPLCSVFLAFFVGGLMLLLLDINPLQIYKKMVVSAFSDPYSIAEIIVKATPLLLTGLSFAFAFKAGLFNIGADGQLNMGALAAVFIALKLGSLPTIIVLPIAFLASLVLGGLWSGLAGYFKAKFNANEIIITIMLNYVAFQFVNFAVNGPLKEKAGSYPQTDPIPRNAYLPNLIPNTRLSIGIVIAIVLAIIFYIIMNKMGIGYRVRAVGLNKKAAKYGGINTNNVLILTMVISGIFSGVAGFIEICGVQHILIQGFAPNVGTVGTVIALLAYANPFGVIFGSFFFGFLKVGANIIKQTSQVPKSAIDMIQGFVVIFVLFSYFARYKVKQYMKLRKLKERSNK